ncbi:MAG: ATP-binding protein, partial [Coriobacteriales bacterium]
FETTYATDPALVAQGISTMPLAEVNRLRQQVLDAAHEYTREDGTVVPEIYAKCRALMDTFGLGTGSNPEGSIDFVQMLFSEQDCQEYIDMPWGIYFTAIDFAEKTDRTVEECKDILDDMAGRGLIMHVIHNGIDFYHHAPVVIGTFEFCVDDLYEPGWIDNFVNSWNIPLAQEGGWLKTGLPIEYAVPCTQDVVADEKILLSDDYREIINNSDVICVIPCSCRAMRRVLDGYTDKPAAEDLPDAYTESCGHPLETCMGFGDEAQYMIDRGIGRQLTKEEALAIIQRSVDLGMIIQNITTKNTAWICSCHGDCCGILGNYLAIGPDLMKQSPIYQNLSHYELNYDKDACIQCGACVERCPMGAIEMDADGYPEVTGICMRCGECGVTCPVSARTLTLKDASERPDLPVDILDYYNEVAGYRFENGFVGQPA